MKTGIEALPPEMQDEIKTAIEATPPEALEEIRAAVATGDGDVHDLPDRMVTLVCPEGAFDYPVSHGEREFYPYRLRVDHTYPAREFGGPWVVDVPIEIYHHFLGAAGFSVYDGG